MNFFRYWRKTSSFMNIQAVLTPQLVRKKIRLAIDYHLSYC